MSSDRLKEGRRWTHRDLIEGRCTSREYVDDLKADVDAMLARSRSQRAASRQKAAEAHASLSRARRLLRRLAR